MSDTTQLDRAPEKTALISALDRYGKNVHLLCVATDRFSEGNGLVVPQATQVFVNPDPQAGDVYRMGSKPVRIGSTATVYVDQYALSKSALERIAMAMGVTWDSTQTRPVVVTKDTVVYQAVGYVRLPDGTRVKISGVREIDLEVIAEESRLLQTRKLKREEFLSSVEDKATKGDYKKADEYSKSASYEDLSDLERAAVDRAVRAEVIEIRKHRMARAETGAKKRAIRQLGLKSTYTDEELKKPFLCVRWGLNPEHEFARAEMRALWGDQVGPMPANPLAQMDAVQAAQDAQDADFTVEEGEEFKDRLESDLAALQRDLDDDLDETLATEH